MPRLPSRLFATPDDVRTIPKVRFETVGTDQATIGPCRFEVMATNALLDCSGLTLQDAGTHELKGLSGERQLFRLAKDGA